MTFNLDYEEKNVSVRTDYVMYVECDGVVVEEQKIANYMPLQVIGNYRRLRDYAILYTTDILFQVSQ